MKNIWKENATALETAAENRKKETRKIRIARDIVALTNLSDDDDGKKVIKYKIMPQGRKF